jgi:hypothetical protein
MGGCGVGGRVVLGNWVMVMQRSDCIPRELKRCAVFVSVGLRLEEDIQP